MTRASNQQSRLAGILAIAAWLALGGVSTTVSAAEFRIARLDRTYSQFVDELAPIEVGPATIELSSPEHELRLQEHQVVLEPRAAGGHSIRLRVVFDGGGKLDARVMMGVVDNTLQDVLTLPQQELLLEGAIAITAGSDGYAIEVLEAPENVEVRIESRLAGRIVPLCKQLSLVMIRMDCDALQAALSKVVVPMPEPGAQFLLSYDELTDEERAEFDAYLGSSGGDGLIN